jgi:hypothetical protein
LLATLSKTFQHRLSRTALLSHRLLLLLLLLLLLHLLFKDKELYMTKKVKQQERRVVTLEKQVALLQSVETIDSPRKAGKIKEI